MKSKHIIVLAGLLFACLPLGGIAQDQAAADPAVVPARAILAPPPEYPESLRAQGVSGMVLLVATVNEKGAVTEVTVTKASHAALERCAVQAVRKWKYKPAQKDGQPVMAKVNVPMVFHLED